MLNKSHKELSLALELSNRKEVKDVIVRACYQGIQERYELAENTLAKANDYLAAHQLPSIDKRKAKMEDFKSEILIPLLEARIRKEEYIQTSKELISELKNRKRLEELKETLPPSNETEENETRQDDLPPTNENEELDSNLLPSKDYDIGEHKVRESVQHIREKLGESKEADTLIQHIFDANTAQYQEAENELTSIVNNDDRSKFIMENLIPILEMSIKPEDEIRSPDELLSELKKRKRLEELK